MMKKKGGGGLLPEIPEKCVSFSAEIGSIIRIANQMCTVEISSIAEGQIRIPLLKDPAAR